MATTINVVKLEPTNDGQDPPKILNFETVASYNWLDEPTPTILVPGTPPIWVPPQISPALKPDIGGRYVDQNADRTPGSPLQALIHAVQTCQPDFDFTNVDIVTDRKPVRCLLGFVNAEPVAFKFGISVVGNTALFTRMEERTRDQPSRRYNGYRDAFEQQYTKIPASAARSTSHHRVVKYDFADLTILVRYAVDAYLGDLAKALMHADGIENTDPGPLVKQRENMNIEGNPPSKTLSSNTPVTVIDGGRHIPHAATLELTTRTKHSQAPDSIEQKLPDFWISQTLNYHLCLHRETKEKSSRSTIFHRIRLIPMGDLLLDWEKTNAEKLRALGHVLRRVIEAAKELGGSCIVSSDKSEGASLKVSRAEEDEVPALPKDMRSLFLPIKNEAVDVPMKQEEVAGQDGTRKRKSGTEHAPELTGSPPARRTALNSISRTPGEVTVPTEDGGVTKTASTRAYDGTRKRKLDAEDAPELTDSPPARRRALKSVLSTSEEVVTTIKEEEPSVKIKDEPVDTEMAL
ncbi:hypothetical protein HO133_001491 [Letharia lupina]|uniref:Geranylgeranyl pyrophosphate synthetase n=1 Tax=Letharia lupina TaxID=560253 RepID=A0A8H6CF38_9LECA|nr:uncharacterized protein HO133_001491 [Letharia lupina]KAF6222405.1 hypothetical protein HO133_001491 [Letharia lupina]